MTKKTLSLKVKRKQAKPLENAATLRQGDDEPSGDPKKRFFNGIAINPSPRIRLEMGSQQLTTRVIDLYRKGKSVT